MRKDRITSEDIRKFTEYLRREERSAATIEKYARYARIFTDYLDGKELTKEAVILFKERISRMYTAAGANGVLAGVNSLLTFLNRFELKVKPLKVQRRLFTTAEREISRAEFDRLIKEAERLGKTRLCLLMQTMFATGIRVSELPFITVEAVIQGRAEIRMKGKIRTVFLPTKLCNKLIRYSKERGIVSGSLFITRSGRPLDRSNIWAEMKSLCKTAQVEPGKVFPHNLRHLFARTYYGKIPNLAELADIMGHSDVNTTRIYTATSGAEYRKRLDSLRLVL